MLASLALLSMKPRMCSTSVGPPRSTSPSIDVAYCESRWENVSSHDLINPSPGAWPQAKCSVLDGGPDDDVADVNMVRLLDRERHCAGDRVRLQRDLVHALLDRGLG